MDRAINLTFHGIGAPRRPLDPGEDAVWISRDQFLAHLDAVAGRDDVRITFDDGNASDVEHALPALRERDLSAMFVVVAGRLGEPRFLDAASVAGLAAAGMEIGCHGMRPRPGGGLSGGDPAEELLPPRRQSSRTSSSARSSRRRARSAPMTAVSCARCAARATGTFTPSTRARRAPAASCR